MSRKITVKVPLSKLQTNLFVRTALDQEHVYYLALLIEGGVTLDPIKMTAGFQVVDGRHRIEAYDLMKVTEIDAEIVEIQGESALIAEAYRANTGGAKPPTPADTEHTVALLLERREPVKNIAELLGLPASMVRKFCDTVKSKQKRLKIQKAVEAVTEGGLTAPKAAEAHGVELKDLKAALSGDRKKRHAEGIADLHRKLTTRYKSIASLNAATMRSILEKLEDGDVKESQVREIVEHLKDLQSKQGRALSDWAKRFEAKVKGMKIA